MSGKQVTLKLVGARQFACAPAGIVDPIAQGGEVTVSPEVAISLRKLTARDKRGNTIRLFANVDEEVSELPELPGPEVRSLDEAVASGDAAKGEGKSSPVVEPEPELSELEQRADEETEVPTEGVDDAPEKAKEPAPETEKPTFEKSKKARRRGGKQ